jgi:hypothetical protein
MRPLIAVIFLACSAVGPQTRRVILPIDVDGGKCYRECMASSSCPPGGPCSFAEFACLQTCRGSRVELGPCAGADLRPNERCWTSRGRF